MIGRPRVLIDGYFLDRPYGFGRYVRELIHALDVFLTDFDPVIVVPFEATESVKALTTRTRVVGRRSRIFPLWEQVVVPAVARSHGCSLVHFPYQSTALGWPRRSTVATIHDLMFLRAGRTSVTLVDRLAHLYRRALFSMQTRHARQLVAVSEATRRELLSYANVDATVVSNVCEAFVAAHRKVEPATAEGRFFLHRGDPGPHKNTRRTIAAFARVRRLAGDARLLVYGASTNTSFLDGLPSAGVTVLGKIGDDRLASLYKSAIAVVAASMEEGFGLSIIEALGFGTTVITSNISPMCDVAGAAGLLVDPTRDEAIADAMSRLLVEPELRAKLLVQGRIRYEQFSSARMAAALRRLYQLALAPAQPRGIAR
jgi:glycosyltransferase involved in cell wall biosynthesis